MQANFEQIIQRIVDMEGQNINSTFFSICAVEFGTNIFSAVKIVWLVSQNLFPLINPLYDAKSKLSLLIFSPLK
jgi:hypothetical protein